MAAQTNAIIHTLMNQYTGGVTFGKNSLIAHVRESINNTGVFASENIIHLSANNSINHTSPACIASPVVTMIAKNAINLGSLHLPQENEIPVRLYVPQELSMTTRNLYVGNMGFVNGFPENGMIACQKLILKKFNEEIPAYFEVLQSYLVLDDTQITILQPNEDGVLQGAGAI